MICIGIKIIRSKKNKFSVKYVVVIWVILIIDGEGIVNCFRSMKSKIWIIVICNIVLIKFDSVMSVVLCRLFKMLNLIMKKFMVIGISVDV